MSKNFIDYIRKKGNKTFNDLLFNEVDAVIFAQLAYVRFEKIFSRYPVTIKEVTEKFLNFSKKKGRTLELYDVDRKYLKALGNSKRFGNLNIIDVKSYVNVKTATQVFAYTLSLNKNERIVVYRGTDESLLGWKEAIKLGVEKKCKGQEVAYNYFLSRVKKEPKAKFYLIGHSKGGNFAIYAASASDENTIKKIKAVYNCDGPNLLDSVKKKTNYDLVNKKITTFLPKASLVGAVLKQVDNVKIVDSEAFSILQHVMYFWKVEGCKFKLLDKRTRFSTIFEKSFRRWILSIPYSVAIRVINLLFNYIDEAGIKNVSDFLNIKNAGSLMLRMAEDIGMRKKSYKKYFKRFILFYLLESLKK